jgi:hypothetical protein
VRALLVLLLLLIPAQAHDPYTDWSSRVTSNCCHNRDCFQLSPERWRQTGARIEIKIRDTWCPVLPDHLLIRGRSPDGSAPHACINEGVATDNPCSRLLCFADMTRS